MLIPVKRLLLMNPHKDSEVCCRSLVFCLGLSDLRGGFEEKYYTQVSKPVSLTLSSGTPFSQLKERVKHNQPINPRKIEIVQGGKVQ